ncbi:MAG: rubredoxin, partial [Clostridia bacterium]|nr:rubredoxin [Clostridia bacterium]
MRPSPKCHCSAKSRCRANASTAAVGRSPQHQGKPLCLPGAAFPNSYSKKGYIIMKYVCDVCGYIYDPAVGDP